MRNVRRAVVMMSVAVGLSTVSALVVVGCGGDDTAVPLDAGNDSTTDSSTDTGVTPDTGSGETGSGDTGTDAQLDAGADVTPVDAAGLTPSQFPAEITKALCARLAECCGSIPDGSAFDQGRCINTNETNLGGFKNLSRREPSLRDGGETKVVFDVAKASTCLTEIRNFTCLTGSTEEIKLRDDCYAALAGTIALNGTGCTDAIQCAAGRCVLAADGGPGTCVALVADGGACNNSDDCAYRGSSVPSLFCEDDFADASPSCAPRLDIDASCGFDTDSDYAACISNVCSVNSTCTQAFLPDDITQACTTFIRPIVDAGGD